MEEKQKQQFEKENIAYGPSQKVEPPLTGEQPSPAELSSPPSPLAELTELLKRTQANFENYRKRLDKEKPELIRWGKAEILLRLLPLYDMLLSAHAHINAARENGGGEETLKGLEMIFKEFFRVFEAEGLRAMEPVGKPYDPMASEILGVVDGSGENDGLVVEELQKGFYYGEKILRPARVKIARKKAAPDPPAEEVPADEAEKGE